MDSITLIMFAFACWLESCLIARNKHPLIASLAKLQRTKTYVMLTITAKLNEPWHTSLQRMIWLVTAAL
jgi:hypothetical protein